MPLTTLPDSRLCYDAFVAFDPKENLVLGVFASHGVALMKLAAVGKEKLGKVLPCKVVFNPLAPQPEPPPVSSNVDTIEAFTV